MGEYPESDVDFEDVTVSKVEQLADKAWSVERSDGWSFFVPADSPVAPEVGMPMRFYGRGIGFQVRGLFIDGRKVYYRTPAEDEEYREIELYGADAKEWLARWDDGRSVWSVEMGGLGPGYEQCIHVTAAEIVRYLIDSKDDPTKWADKDEWSKRRKDIETMGFANPVVEKLGLSGAQWGAAMSLATHLYRDGPRGVMKNEAVKDRRIQVSKNFP